ncbi:stage 0 sporulation protein F [Pontibacillus halophilus JSM 076056 = DSM 19796]|uniref:Stage 0 sporulation protein F n=1 Tax=Pontibacillus halophilus JSM 076056 = DSM 19796 TaxID=1385510 RepID=A0A0A5GPF1_9BACI|nr:response regulator [Pontibacillus halophilus]KGX93864.1 stage 0 sporulation protein F [Pontibacillus halophilus JSM 076056 = DSM 19796]
MSKTILVVDDQPGIRILLEEVIRNEGYHVTLAENGIEAMEEFKQHHPSLVILDMKLPGKDGPTVAREMEQLSPSTPIVFISGLAEEEWEEVRTIESVRTILAKPFDIYEIKDILKEYSV